MLLIALLIYGIYSLFKIPGLLKATPEMFPGAPIAMFQDWRKKELWSHYIVLIAGWGMLIVLFLVVFLLAIARVINQSSLQDLAPAINILAVVFVIGGAIWSSVLSSGAKKLKLQMIAMQQAAGGYYPRPGMPPSPPPPYDPNFPTGPNSGQ